MRALSSLLLASTLAACEDSTAPAEDSTAPAIDTDMDGITDADDPTPNGSTRNRLNGTFTGGFARAVEITWYDDTGVEDVDMTYEYDLDVDCADEWYPQGTLCDESPTTDDPNVSTKTNYDSGATWDTSVAGPNSGTGVLVVDACYTGDCTAIDVNEARVFQMYSDGKATHVRIFFHPELGDTPPAWNDAGWVAQGGFVTIDEGALAVPGEPLVVTSPTIIELTPTVTRYVRLDVQNDNRYAVTDACCTDPGYYIELRSVKFYSVALSR